MARQQVVQGGTQSVDIGEWGERWDLCQQFRGDVAGRARRREIGVPHRYMGAGDVEVDQNEPPVSGKHHILRFDVAKRESGLLRVQIIQDRAELDPHAKHLLHRREVSLCQVAVKVLGERLSLDKLHHHTCLGVINNQVVEAGNAGMLQRGEDARFVKGAPDCSDLECHGPRETRFICPRLIDDGRAFAYLADDLILLTRWYLANHHISPFLYGL